MYFVCNSTGTQALRYAATPEMKNFINGVFNPHLAEDDHKDNNDNENDNLISNPNDENNTNQGNTVEEVGA